MYVRVYIMWLILYFDLFNSVIKKNTFNINLFKSEKSSNHLERVCPKVKPSPHRI